MIEQASTPDLEKRDAAVESVAERFGVGAERGRRFAELTSLRVGGTIDGSPAGVVVAGGPLSSEETLDEMSDLSSSTMPPASEDGSDPEEEV